MSGKWCHFIIDYNYRISWLIFINFVPLETGMNTPQSHVIYLLNGLMTSRLWEVTAYENLWYYNVDYKKCRFIFVCNYGNYWQILIIFVPLETEINTLPSIFKMCHFNLTISPYYLIKLITAQKQLTVPHLRFILNVWLCARYKFSCYYYYYYCCSVLPVAESCSIFSNSFPAC